MGVGIDHQPRSSKPLLSTLLTRRVAMRGFIVFDDFGYLMSEFFDGMGAWLTAGKIHYKEHRVQGLELAPAAFIDLLVGKNFGKLIVSLEDEK